SSADWHRLVEICVVTQTLLADEAAVYDPRDPNDRLLLGVKGTISEAELFTLRCRLHEGRWNKARRGELARSLPVGYVRTGHGGGGGGRRSAAPVRRGAGGLVSPPPPLPPPQGRPPGSGPVGPGEAHDPCEDLGRPAPRASALEGPGPERPDPPAA